MSLRKDPALCRFKGCTRRPRNGKRMCHEHGPMFERIRRELEESRGREYVIRRGRRKKALPDG